MNVSSTFRLRSLYSRRLRTLCGYGLAVAALAACNPDDDSPAGDGGASGAAGASGGAGAGGTGGAPPGGSGAGGAAGSGGAADPEANEVLGRVSAPAPAGQPCEFRNTLKSALGDVSRRNRVGYDEAGRVSFIDRFEDDIAGEGGAGLGPEVRFGLFHDAAGRPTRLVFVSHASARTEAEETFGYDASGRLVSIGALGSSQPPRTIAYDAGGAGWSVTAPGAPAASAAVDAAAKTLALSGDVGDFFAPLAAGRTTFRDAVPAPGDLFVPAFAGFLAAHPLAGVEDDDADGVAERTIGYAYEGELLRRVTFTDVARPGVEVGLEYLYACGPAARAVPPARP